MERGFLTRVSKDFFTTIDGELSLTKGDYFLIHEVIDKHWYYGESRGREGKFPSNHLHKVDIPDIQETEKLFVSIAIFRGEQTGDLSFGEGKRSVAALTIAQYRKKAIQSNLIEIDLCTLHIYPLTGELIVGTRQIETNWYFGHVDSREGIFPLSHVWLLDQTILKKPSHKKSVRKRAKVKTSLKAQLDEELDLKEGEIVTVLEIFEDGWVRGTTEDGKVGTFPEGFVSYIEDTEVDQMDRQNSSFYRGSMGVESLPNSIMQGGAIYKDFGQTNSTNYNDEPAPSYYDIFPDASASSLNSQSNTAFSHHAQTFSQPSIEISQPLTEDNLNPLGVEPYAITLYPFNAQFSNELSFGAGEVVHLIKHLDTEWAEGTIDDARGFFPISYVKIIVNSTNANEDPPQRTLQEPETRSQDGLEPGASVKVDYTFDAQMDGDLSVTEGDIVTVVEMANDDWVSVRNSDGAVGLCPRAYLNSETQVASDTESDLLEDFVIMRHEKKSEEEITEEGPKRLSEPHRPAPPVPAPGRMPLQKQTINEKTVETFQDSEQGSESSPALAEKQKRADRRQNVISELVITEKEYVRDLKVTYETFNLYNPCFLESRGIDVATLFGNILEVIQVAEELLDLVLRSMKGCDENYQTIAPCFLKMTDKLQKAYGRYCGNHEAALILLKKYEDNKEIMNIFDKGIETLRRQVVCFDMSSILIKPVQRILKYPLMLYELIKCTEEDHPDREGIEEAWKAMTEVASYINEYKRRKDLLSKYLDGDNTLMRKMAKLTMHSVAKKSSRLSAILSASLGLTNLTSDPEFEELERQFKSLEKCTWQLSKDVEQCFEFLDDEAKCGELISILLTQYYSGTPDNEIKRYADSRAKIRSEYVGNLRRCIEKRVNVPVESLITLLEGPAVLITKRYHKLLDYDNAISKSDKNKESRIAQEELNVAKTNFEALNQQLLEELPILIDASTSILAQCVGAFANARKLLTGQIMKCYLSLSVSATQVLPQDILESFLVNHNLVWNQIIRNTFTDATPRVTETPVDVCSQNEEQRIRLRSRYPSDRLYLAKENIASTSSLDLSAVKDTLVAVIKKQDPMGDANRWFVDNGIAQGFVPCRRLERVSAIRDSTQSSVDDTDSIDSTPDLMSLDSPEKIMPQKANTNSQTNWYTNVDGDNAENAASINLDAFSQPQRYQNIQPEFFYASYDFHEDIEGTLAVTKGQALKLIQRHDNKGNDAWWLMEDRFSKTGYVPRNYLSPMSSAK